MDVHRLTLERFRDWLKTEKDSWFLWYYLLHGNSGAIAWPEGWFYKNEGGAAIDLYILGLKDVFKTVQGDMSLPFTSPGSQFVPDPIGIYYSHAGVQAGWVMDALVHGKSWPRRAYGFE